MGRKTTTGSSTEFFKKRHTNSGFWPLFVWLQEKCPKIQCLLSKAQYPKAQSLELPTNGDAEEVEDAPEAVADDKAAGAEAPNNQFVVILLAVELLAACVRPWVIGIELLPGTDMVHEDARGGF